MDKSYINKTHNAFLTFKIIVIFFPSVDETFILSFHTDFKNINFTLVKSAPKNCFSQKTVPEKSVFGKNVLVVLFNKAKWILIPHSTFSKKKVSIS